MCIKTYNLPKRGNDLGTIAYYKRVHVASELKLDMIRGTNFVQIYWAKCSQNQIWFLYNILRFYVMVLILSKSYIQDNIFIYRLKCLSLTCWRIYRNLGSSKDFIIKNLWGRNFCSTCLSFSVNNLYIFCFINIKKINTSIVTYIEREEK